MTEDPGILCFQHCDNAKIFCFTPLPLQCPQCGQHLANSSDLMPFRLPYPFVKPQQYPCSIVMRPTDGDFMNDYYNSMDLHIGLTSSDGTIVEFDQRGLSTTKARHIDPGSVGWSQSLLVDTVPASMYSHWDDVLHELCTSEATSWNAKSYEAQSYNCYTFVLTFLQKLGYGQLSRAATNRTDFCEQFIVPRTTQAGKYISLYRKLRNVAFYVHNANEDGGKESV